MYAYEREKSDKVDAHIHNYLDPLIKVKPNLHPFDLQHDPSVAHLYLQEVLHKRARETEKLKGDHVKENLNN